MRAGFTTWCGHRHREGSDGKEHCSQGSRRGFRVCCGAQEHSDDGWYSFHWSLSSSRARQGRAPGTEIPVEDMQCSTMITFGVSFRFKMVACL